MRQGNWKAHGFKAKCELYNLAKDPSETKDLASTNPEKARELSKLHGAWLKEMVASENAGKPAGAAPAPAAPASPARMRSMHCAHCHSCSTSESA